MATKLERLKELADRERVSYPADATVETLTELLYAHPTFAAQRRNAAKLAPKPGKPVVWVGSGDDDMGNWHR